ncbi:class I SAM-dependent methyltransferase [Nonlabens agnitus]|uniref:Methyltransferase n=1 Tax=Nonlabens agnitus TaxID=870484 RepID=A0A2S9WWK8_9FLAO|nr:class I SAM-dependent methyltransferase [Nonlabens agnitus]PRP67766.1 methyltransferase [Nonlabens agnitus]
MIKKTDLYLETRDHFLTQKRFEISKTSIEGLLITTPQPRDLDKYYDTSEYLSHDDSNNSLFARLYRFARKLNIKSKFKLISKYDAGGRILDVGAGNGELVKYLVQERLDAQGYEPSELARKVAYQKGVRLLDHLPVRNKQHYQVIQMFHVLEHVKDPQKLLDDLYSMLTDDGILIIALPNYESLDAKIFKSYWAGYDVPRHLYHFNEKGISNLTSSKFNLIEKRPMWFDSFYVSILSARYKKLPLAFLCGIFIGICSNIMSLLSSEPSSRIYAFKKSK